MTDRTKPVEGEKKDRHEVGAGTDGGAAGTLDADRPSLLSGIRSPADLRALPEADIPALCQEIRQVMVDTVSRNGGHLASNLGAVELSVAMHRVFDCPHDHFIFDVGHQSYVHKLLTGRYERFGTLREHVVDAHCNHILSDRIVLIHHEGQLELGADSVGT